MTTPTAPTGWPTVSVQFAWGETALSFPSGSQLFRPEGDDSRAVVVDREGLLFTISEDHPTGQRWPDQPDSDMVADADEFLYDQSVTFP